MKQEEIDALKKWEKLTRRELGDHIENLLDHAEKMAAMATKWRAWSMFIEEELDAIPQDKNYGDYYQEYERKAARELGIEATTWRKIDEATREQVERSRAVLRKLLEGRP